MPYNTGNALGSDDPRDLRDNAQIFDRLANGAALSTPDRFGKQRLTWAGIEQRIADAIINSGYEDIGAYTAGLVVQRANQIFSRAGEYYRAKPGVALPYTLTGNWANESGFFVAVGDASIRAALAAATGEHLVGAQIPGGAVMTLGDVNEASVVTIQKLGGAGDYDVATGQGTNNFFPLLNYTRLHDDCPTVHFPFITGETNVYYFFYETIYGLGPGTVKLTADKGVKFKCVNVGFDCDGSDIIEIIPNILMGYTYQQGDSYFGQPLGEKRRDFISAGDLIKNKFRKINPSVEMTAKRLTWPGSLNAGGTDIEVLTGSAAITLTADAIEFSTTGTGYYEVGEMRIKVGDRIHAYYTIPPGVAGITPACFARSALAYKGMTWVNGAAGTVDKEGGEQYSQAAIQKPQDSYRQLHATFDPNQAILTIEPTSGNECNFLVNGALFRKVTFKEPIQGFSFGGYLGGPATGVKVEGLYLEEGGAQNAATLLGLHYVGDSRQADMPSAPGRYAAKLIDGSLGARVVQYTNQAVGGQGSGDQLAIMQANGIPPGTTDTVIAVGTNNQQAGTGPGSLYSDLTTMCGIAKAANSRVTLDIYPLWYEQNQAGAGHGQATQRYAAGNPYRATIMRVAAEQGAVTVDGLTEYGILIANMVNANTNPNLTWMDPIIPDNIHGNPTLGKLQGFAHAKAILGQISKVNTNETPWIAMPSVWGIQNGFSMVAGKSNKFRVAPGGDVAFKLELNFGSSRANGTQVFGAGRLLTPDAPLELPAFTSNHERGSLVVDPDGGFRIYGFEGTTGTILRVNSGLYSTIY